MNAFIDYETTGLLRHRDLRAHCMGYAIDSNPVQLAVGHEEIAAVLATIPEDALVVAHYGSGFDFPLTRRLFGRTFKQTFDTKVAGSLFDPEFSGTHSLEDWGVRVQAPKDAYAAECEAAGIDPWAEYTPRMGDYCKQDVETLRSVFLYQQHKWMQDHDWTQSLAVEHAISAVMAEQAHSGCWFDKAAALKLREQMVAEIASLTAECSKLVKPKCVPGEEVAKLFRKDGTLSANGWKALGYASEAAYNASDTQVVGDFQRVAFSEYDLDSRQQVIALLQLHGWKPTEYTEKGNARFTEESITASVGPVGKALATRFVTITRLGQLDGWLSKVREDGRIEAKAQSNATPTGRMRHSVVVNVPKPGTKWGVEMRALFAVPEGMLQVGVDAAGLELRMLAHYMGDAEFTRQVCEGDVHWYIAQKIGLIAEGTARIKDKAHSDYDLHHRVRECEKRWIYAVIYGAGDPKLGESIGEFKLPGWRGTEAEGALTRQRIMVKLPKLAKLMERIDATLWMWAARDQRGNVVECAKESPKARRVRRKQWLLGLDGRKLYVRHDHAALNTLLQSAGSIVVKAATCYAHTAIKKRKLPAKQIMHFHDECVYETDPEAGGQVAWLFQEGIRWAAQKYKVRCPLAGNASYGFSWAETH